MNRIIIALDAMGGDHAPGSVLDGAALALQREPSLYFHIFGNQEKILPWWQQHPALQDASVIYHTNEVIEGNLKPTHSLKVKEASLRLAINEVASQKAQAIVSGGNTGAYMTLAKLLLKMIPGIDRPALPALVPNLHSATVLLDAGANLQCNADNLVQFALMGSCLARIYLQKTAPAIGLLNIGSEASKGHLFLQETAKRLESIKKLNFQGFIEGKDITNGAIDVVITDGFSGNLALKAIEGAGQLFAHLLEQNFATSWRSRLGYWLARPSLEAFKISLDPRYHNGTLFLGLHGLAVKSHGSMDAVGFAHAIGVSARMIQQQLISNIIHAQEAYDFIGPAPVTAGHAVA